MQLGDILNHIISNGYITSASVIVLLIYAISKLWHKYDEYLKFNIDNGVNDNKETLNEIKNLVKDTVDAINSINHNLDDFKRQINTLETLSDNIVNDIDVNHDKLLEVMKEVDFIKQNLEALRYAMLLTERK